MNSGIVAKEDGALEITSERRSIFDNIEEEGRHNPL